MSGFSCALVGDQSLLIQCGRLLLQGGSSIVSVITRNKDVRAWAAREGIPVDATGEEMIERLAGDGFEWLFSIANLSVISPAVLAKARSGAINFHDGPLPKHAGLNAPVWAILQGEPVHGVTWHMIEAGIDQGDIVKQQLFDLEPNETAFSLNMRCYEAAIESFGELLGDMSGRGLQRSPQNLGERTYHARFDRPAAAARLDFAQPAEQLVVLVSALDHSTYWNPLASPKVAASGQVFTVTGATLEPRRRSAAPGTVIEATEDFLVVTTASVPVRLTGLRDASGQPVAPSAFARVGDVLPTLDAAESQSLTDAMAHVVEGEDIWRRCLQTPQAIDLPSVTSATGAASYRQTALRVPAGLGGDRLLAAVAAWVARVSGKSAFDLAFRDACAPRAPGYLSTWVPLRILAESDSVFPDFLGQVTAALDQARSHPAFALDLLVRDPAIKGLETPEVGLSEGAGFIEGTAVTLERDRQGGLVLWRDAARLTDEVAAQLAQRLQSVLDALGSEDGRHVSLGSLPIMSAAEREQVLYGWNETRTEFERDKCVHQFFEAQVLRTPEAIAVAFEGTVLTYAELNARANRVAHRLRGMGVQRGSLVGIYTLRSPDLIVGVLAIQKAGAGYVPLDPAYPVDRVALYIEDSGAPVIVTQSQLAASLPAHSAQVFLIDQDTGIASQPDTVPDSGVQPADVAYMIYTSGSTGRPKGVVVEHRNVANLFRGLDDRVAHNPPGIWLAITSQSFDMSIPELFYTLARGFKMVLASDETRALVSSGESDGPTEFADDDFSIAAQIVRHGVTHLQCTPSMARMIAMSEEARGALAQVRYLLIGGEAMPGTLVTELGRITQASIENMYGPTETTVWSSTETASASETVVNIGRPMANTQMYVLDTNRQPVPVGVPGELYIGGDGVTRGYWQRPELTAERFVPDPFVQAGAVAAGGARMYRTGDLARWRPDGRIDFLGRADFQVKIRGYRIELGEIEAVLELADDVRQAVAIAREDQPGDVRLVAYLRVDAGFSAERLREWVATRLPAHMVPAHFVTVDEFPLTPTRKVDRKALPVPSYDSRERSEAFVPPENEVEKRIAAIWSTVLGVPLVGAHDSFFDLGGNSLLAVGAIAALKREFGRKLSVGTLKSSPTPAAMRAVLTEGSDLGAPQFLVIIQSGKGHGIPLYGVHSLGHRERFYRPLVERLGPDHSVFGLTTGYTHLEDSLSVEQLAQLYFEDIQKHQPQGPLALAAVSMCAYVAYELARQLTKAGREVAYLVLFDSDGPDGRPPLRHRGQALVLHWKQLRKHGIRYLMERVMVRLTESGGIGSRIGLWLGQKFDMAQNQPFDNPADHTFVQNLTHAVSQYVPREYGGPVVIFYPTDEPFFDLEKAVETGLGWRGYATGSIDLLPVPGKHISMLAEPHVAEMARLFAGLLSGAKPAMSKERTT